MLFTTILDNYRKYSFSERDKGAKFEKLMQSFLLTYQVYKNLFSDVWLWNDFPFKKEFGSGQDTGIDLVAKTFGGDYWAIQCKCYQDNVYINKEEVDSFLVTSSKSFENENFTRINFSNRLWISTTNNWSSNAEESIKNQNPVCNRISLYDLEQAEINWEELEKGIIGEKAENKKKELREHQIKALNSCNEYFKTADRGKLIMACGTGKTFTSLKIAENETNNCGLILFLVPSIALLGQTLKEWSAQSSKTINTVCICSDAEISNQKTKNNNDDSSFNIEDLVFPASTNINNIVRQFEQIERRKLFNKKNNIEDGMTVVFSTYQSIEVISKAQKELNKNNNDKYIFDLIICDEAHRTTGVILKDKEESAFTKVHDNEFLISKKRLYMTATPRLYDVDAKSKAFENDTILCSMDDKEQYGEEIYRIGFGEAVKNDLLSDYKVLVLTINENSIPKNLQNALLNQEDKEIQIEDAQKLIGCINALSKKLLFEEELVKSSDPSLMKRAVVFCQNIKISKKITNVFNDYKEFYYESLTNEERAQIVNVSSQHIDGTMGASIREQKLSWLKAQTNDEKECRLLTNVKCLSEGVDVPSLDAIIFLSEKNSEVDVVQSIGRVMRKSPNKKYGYIIIPVVIPLGSSPEDVLDKGDKFKIVWKILNALRAHDDRFNAMVNHIELNKNKTCDQKIIFDTGGFSDNQESNEDKLDKTDKEKVDKKINEQLELQYSELQNVIYARLVKKVGNRTYWEQWAKEVAEIAQTHIARITKLVNSEGKYKLIFKEFINGLHQNINPSILESDAIEMLAQHMITQPVFEALFENYSFVKNNPVSQSMQNMVNLLEEQSISNDLEKLQKFYDSIKQKVEGIDNAEGKQKVIIELYDKFFKTAFPKTVEKLGIVYTPIEVVDFIINSVADVLKTEFNRTLSDENIHILDPFTGTGTFITRLLQSGLIKNEDLERKYTKELHANEIVLLAYYIASINIENTYHDKIENSEEYKPFNGICLTDTFQLGETNAGKDLFSEMFPQNSERVINQQKASLRIIIGNPPYSVGQESQNDNAQNQSYPLLEKKIENSYVKYSNAGLNKSCYDSYIKSFRWSSDRLDPINGGIIAFVSNGSWLDNNSLDGFRHCLEEEFSSIYIFNLRGNQRTSGELSRKEGGKIFGSGSRTPIAITILVKKPNNTEKAKIYYYDIGDYLNREEKLKIISKFKSIENLKNKWQEIKPNKESDWLAQRNDIFNSFISIEPEKKYDIKSKSFFITYSLGLLTARDSWCYNMSINSLKDNLKKMIDFYNEQRILFHNILNNKIIVAKDFISYDPTKIGWTHNIIFDLEKNKEHQFNDNNITQGLYRPFNKQHVYFDNTFNERVNQQTKLFPTSKHKNIVICIAGVGSSKNLSNLVTNYMPDYQVQFNGQCFPLYYYEKVEQIQKNLFSNSTEEYVRKDAISDFILNRARENYGSKVIKEDIFYYVYGILHSKEYRQKFAIDLKKMLPRIPLVEEPRLFWTFSKAGRELADLHLNYEGVKQTNDLINNVKVIGRESNNFIVEKIKFANKNDKSIIIYNSQIRIENIPLKAYEYIVNGKSAIEWILDRYQVTINKDSQIKNDPNDWAIEQNKPSYILDLLLSVIELSVKTVDIVNGLPELKFEDNKE